MFTILQAAIGISFVFLLVSLTVSAANELLQAILATRARQLKAGIGELLQDRNVQGAAKAFCNHPLISCLSKGSHGQPSYIAPSTFVTTVLDLLRDGQIVVDNTKSTDLADQIAKIQNPELRRALNALFNQASQESAKFENALEDWFNEAMDRVSGWYKRWIQYWLFGLGLALAVGANVDALHIIGALSTDPKLRLATADSALEYLRRQSDAERILGGSSKNQHLPANSSSGTAPDGSVSFSKTLPATAQSLEKAATDLASLEVPLGWAGPERSYVRMHWWSAFLGWFLTGLAASTGAPFWFDTLNRFINVRAAGRAPGENLKGAKRAVSNSSVVPL